MTKSTIHVLHRFERDLGPKRLVPVAMMTFDVESVNQDMQLSGRPSSKLEEAYRATSNEGGSWSLNLGADGARGAVPLYSLCHPEQLLGLRSSDVADVFVLQHEGTRSLFVAAAFGFMDLTPESASKHGLDYEQAIHVSAKIQDNPPSQPVHLAIVRMAAELCLTSDIMSRDGQYLTDGGTLSSNMAALTASLSICEFAMEEDAFEPLSKFYDLGYPSRRETIQTIAKNVQRLGELQDQLIEAVRSKKASEVSTVHEVLSPMLSRYSEYLQEKAPRLSSFQYVTVGQDGLRDSRPADVDLFSGQIQVAGKELTIDHFDSAFEDYLQDEDNVIFAIAEDSSHKAVIADRYELVLSQLETTLSPRKSSALAL